MIIYNIKCSYNKFLWINRKLTLTYIHADYFSHDISKLSNIKEMLLPFELSQK